MRFRVLALDVFKVNDVNHVNHRRDIIYLDLTDNNKTQSYNRINCKNKSTRATQEFLSGATLFAFHSFFYRFLDISIRVTISIAMLIFWHCILFYHSTSKLEKLGRLAFTVDVT